MAIAQEAAIADAKLMPTTPDIKRRAHAARGAREAACAETDGVAELALARRLGDELLVDVGARGPDHIDPIETAKHLGIEVTFGHLNGATARIFRNGAKARIRVSDRIVTVGRRRFSIMHEIGHYLLNHALPTEGDETSWFATCWPVTTTIAA
ncbi:MAG: ImmA/IrrE family metallo-endopeptidase [Deltaproteobacteria bacterium]